MIHTDVSRIDKERRKKMCAWSLRCNIFRFQRNVFCKTCSSAAFCLRCRDVLGSRLVRFAGRGGPGLGRVVILRENTGEDAAGAIYVTMSGRFPQIYRAFVAGRRRRARGGGGALVNYLGPGSEVSELDVSIGPRCPIREKIK